MVYFFVNEALPCEVREVLGRYGECVSLPPFEKLLHPVSGHPDMLMAKIGDALFIHREYEAGQRILTDLGVPFFLSEKAVGHTYPDDIALNCFSASRCLFGKISAISDEVKSFAAREGLTLKNVAQGYAKCSSAVIEKVLVTADRGICAAANVEGLKTMLISPGRIGIEVYDTGFIGGASVTLNENTIGFFGSLASHPEGEGIRAFFEKNGIEVVELSDGALFDYGGAVRVVK